MSRLDKYQSALLAAFPDVSEETLVRKLDSGGSEFATFIIDHGLGPQWHLRTERAEFHESRLAAEALFLAQEHALKDIDAALDRAEIEYVVIKGAANRLILYENPAIRACHDIDLLVRPNDRVQAASALLEAGFCGVPCVPAIADDTKALTYGRLYDLPYYTCGEVLTDDYETIPVATAIRRIFDMTDAEYQAESDLTYQYVQPYSMDSIMQKFLEHVKQAPPVQNIESYSNWKYVSYCFKWIWFQARSTFAVRSRLRHLIRSARIE
jgi:hypothetical protein